MAAMPEGAMIDGNNLPFVEFGEDEDHQNWVCLPNGMVLAVVRMNQDGSWPSIHVRSKGERRHVMVSGPPISGTGYTGHHTI